MTGFVDVEIGEIFTAVNGKAKFIRDYIDKNSGDHPVYSASLLKPFGTVREFDYDGDYLTWVMNGYGGRVQRISGKFSANRDRGVFVPRAGIQIPDLTYLRYVMEPQLSAAAVGRRVDGRLNEYTKIYPDTAMSVQIRLPIDQGGNFDYAKMSSLGEQFRRIDAAQLLVRQARDQLENAVFGLEIPGPSITVSLSDENYFSLSIGKRVLKSEHQKSGIPVYSANALFPFGFVSSSNLDDFTKASLLWGIDGNFDWNLIPAGHAFATTDHCGRLQINEALIDPEYLYWYLSVTRPRYGFDRVFRASLENMKSEVVAVLPLDDAGRISLDRQKEYARTLRNREAARKTALTAVGDVLKARVSAES